MFDKAETDFIYKHQNDDCNSLRLKFSSSSDLNYSFLINQIETRKKAKTKTPTLFNTKNFVFPPSSNFEQSSSEITANYKAKIINGKKGIDLTGGFGIDTIYMSKLFNEYSYIEPNIDLFKISTDNFKNINLKINSYNITCEEFLNTNSDKFDWLYLDPSRKSDGNKTVFLDDYFPNVIELKRDLFKISDQILIKTSPLLDIKDTLTKLKKVSEIHIVSVKNEVKEVLYILKNEHLNSLKINTINYTNNIKPEELVIDLNALDKSISTYSEPQKYIYEPNAAIMKSGAFNYISEFYKLHKLHNNSHLYTSNELKRSFPGRKFELIKSHQYNKKELKSYQKANIATRNFPNSVEEIRKKTKIKDGGNVYLFGTTLINEKPVILACSKIEDK